MEREYGEETLIFLAIVLTCTPKNTVAIAKEGSMWMGSTIS